MCLRPRFIVNRYYLKLTHGDVLHAQYLYGKNVDFYIKVGCGLCVECVSRSAQCWAQRLCDHYEYLLKNGYDKSKVSFVTLTCAPEFYDDFKKSPNVFVRRFLERYRKRYGRSFDHYIVSEYGEKRGRLHFHMVAFGMLCNAIELRKLWFYGRVDLQVLKGDEGLGYIAGYVNKKMKEEGDLFVDPNKKSYRWVSPGLGKAYTMDYDRRSFHIQHGHPVPFRMSSNGAPIPLPRYYYDKIFSSIDKYNLKRLYFEEQLSFPKPPYRVHRRYFTDVVSYFRELHALGGYPLLSFAQLRILNVSQLNSYFYGQ